MIRRLRSMVARFRGRVWALHPRAEVGARVKIGRWCRISIEPGARIQLGDGVEIDDGCTLAAYGHGGLEFGDGVFLGHHCTVAARERVTIGPSSFLGELVSVRDHDHDPAQPPAAGATLVESVRIGADVWLGSKVTVLRGASIGDGSVIGANAVVAGDVAPASVAVGIPARVVRSTQPPV